MYIRKEEFKQKALSHVSMMDLLYQEDIQHSIEQSKIYGLPQKIKIYSEPEQLYFNTGSVEALYEIRNKGKTCVLNFASYKFPGGGFLNGMYAQEEALCHDSALYNVIGSHRFAEYYDYNNQHKNHGLYTDRAIYSPDVIFNYMGAIIKADVLTCAAPNKHAAARNQISEQANLTTYQRRIEFIADILEENKVEIFVAGAYGCGVFGQDPNDLVKIWKQTKYGEHLKLIVHPVPSNSYNATVFSKAFERGN